jgi:hypothetical protein
MILATVPIPAIIPNIEPKETLPKYSLRMAPRKGGAPQDRGKRMIKTNISPAI